MGVNRANENPRGPIRSHLFRVEVLQVVEREHRLEAFPEGLKLPGHAFVQSPIDHQLRGEEGEPQGQITAGQQEAPLRSQTPTLRYSSRL